MDPNLSATNTQLEVTIRNPQQVVYSGKADSITSANETGPFDILPMHANFITIIKENVIVHQKGQKDITVPLDEGIMKVYENTINIFLGFESMKQTVTS